MEKPMNKYATAYDHFPFENSPVGSHIEPTYGMVFDDESGRSVPGITGEINVFDRIQSGNVGLSVQEILRNSILTGDQDVLAARSGFLDTTKMPTSRAEWEKRKIAAEEVFAALPVEARRAFDFDMFKFLDAVDNGMFNQVEDSTPEVIADEA